MYVYYVCMNTRKQAVEVLVSTETALRDLAEQALSESDYGSLAEIARLVDRVAAIARDSGRPAAESATGQPARTGSRGGKHLRLKKTYPIFVTDGDQLVKIGWSKSKRREYEQRAPRTILEALVSAIEPLGSEKRRWTMEDILPLTDPESGDELPNYQPYLCLRFLLDSGLVEKHGRNGYSLVHADGVRDRTASFWSALTAREYTP